MIFGKSPVMRFRYKGYLFLVKFVWRGITLFINLSMECPDEVYFEARHWFMANQHEFNLTGMTDPLLGYLEI